MDLDDESLEMLPAKAYIPPSRDQSEKRQHIALLGPDSPFYEFPSITAIGQSSAPASPRGYCYNSWDSTFQINTSTMQEVAILNLERPPLEMQHSASYIPLMLHGADSAAVQPEPGSPTSVYDTNMEEYGKIAGENPYYEANELVTVPFNKPSSNPTATNRQRGLSNSQSMRSIIKLDTSSIPGASFPPRDEALRALIPDGLKWPGKTAHECRPHLTTPEDLRRPKSFSASVYEVESLFSATARVIKSPCQSPTQSPNQSPERSPARSPTRSLDTIEEESSTESTSGLKRKPTTPGERVHKKLFGDNGWLDDHRPALTPRRRPSVMRELGRKLKGLAGDSPKSSSPTSGPISPTGLPSPFTPVSLMSGQQSKLYAELEVMICTTANNFILNEYYSGRVSQQSIEKVYEFWTSKNRPLVTEFQFDQATQRDLIVANRRSLRFAGESSTNPIMLESNLSNWRVIAQEMNVRTFCLPDSAIRKHLHDTRNILDMLDASIITLQQFRNVSNQAQEEMMDGYIKRRPRTSSSQQGFTI